MRVSGIQRSAVASAALSLVSLTACSAAETNATTMPPAVITSPIGDAFAKSSTGAMYISDSGTNEVDVYGWPKPQNRIGTLVGVSEPQGECADRSGNVFITNTGDSNVLKFRIGDSKPADTLDDFNWYPVACAFDAVSGTLAVANTESTADRSGSVSLYANATGTPHVLSGGALQRPFQVAYDGSSNLFGYGENKSYQLQLAELSAGSIKLRPVCKKLLSSHEILGIGSDGKYLLFAVSNGVDRISNCKVVGFTRLLGPVGDVVIGHRLVAVNGDEVAIYAYPKGGFPIQTLQLTGVSEPIGVAIAKDFKGK